MKSIRGLSHIVNLKNAVLGQPIGSESLADIMSSQFAPGNQNVKAYFAAGDMAFDLSTSFISPVKLVVLKDEIPGITKADSALFNIGVGSPTFKLANDSFQGLSSLDSIIGSSTKIYNNLVPTTAIQPQNSNGKPTTASEYSLNPYVWKGN